MEVVSPWGVGLSRRSRKGSWLSLFKAWIVNSPGTGEGRETERRLGREQLEKVFSRLRRSCARLDKTAMLRRLPRAKPVFFFSFFLFSSSPTTTPLALAANKSPAIYILSPALGVLPRENRGSMNRLYRTWSQASSGNSDSANWPGYDAADSTTTTTTTTTKTTVYQGISIYINGITYSLKKVNNCN